MKAERHVGDAEHGRRAGEFRLDPPDRFDRLHRVAAQSVVPGAQRERERIEDEIARLEAVPVDGEIVETVRHPQFPVDVSRLSLLVDQEADDRRTVFPGQPEHPIGPGPGLVAILEVRGVEDRPSAQTLEPGLHDFRLGRIENDRNRDLGREPTGERVHVDRAVPADVVDAQIDEMGRLAHLILSDRHTTIEIAGEHRFTERPGSVRVGSLADDQERRVLSERRRAVDRRNGRLMNRVAARDGDRPARLDHGCDVSRGRPAAASDDVDAELRHEPADMSGELAGRQVVSHLPVHDLRQSGVRDDRDGHPGVLRQVSQRLVHLFRAGRAVEPDHVGPHRVQRRQRGADLGAGEHAAGQFDRDLNLEGKLDSRPAHRPPRAVHRRLGSEEVELGLDDEQVDAAVDQARCLRLIGVAQFPVRDLAERGELRPGPDRTGDEPRAPVTSDVLVGDGAGDASSRSGELVGAMLDAVLGEGDGEAAERVRLDDVDADVEEGSMERRDHIGTAHVQDLHAALEIVAAEVVDGQIRGLERSSRSPVEDDEAAPYTLEIAAHGDPPGGSDCELSIHRPPRPG